MSDQKTISKIKDPRLIAAVLTVSLVLSLAANFGLITPQQSQEWQNMVQGYAEQIDQLESAYANLTDQYQTLKDSIDIPTNSSLSAMRKGYSFQVSFTTNYGVPTVTAALQSGVNGSLIKYSSNQTLIWGYATTYASAINGSIYLAEGNWNSLTVDVPAGISITIDSGAYGYTLGSINGTLTDYHNLAFYKNGRITQAPYNYLIDKDGDETVAQAANGTVCFISTNTSALFQDVVNALDGGGTNGARGIIQIKGSSSNYNIDSSITLPEGNGALTIKGDGRERNTVLMWNGNASGYMFLATACGKLYIEDLSLRGGSSGSESGHALNATRDVADDNIELYIKNVDIQYFTEPSINAYYLADSQLTNLLAINNVGYDIISNYSSHLKLYGGNVGKLWSESSLLTWQGGTAAHIALENTQNYVSTISGLFFDPVPTGYGTHITVGVTAFVDQAVIEGNTFGTSAESNSVLINKGRGTVLRDNMWSETALTTMLNMTSNSQDTAVYNWGMSSITPAISYVTSYKATFYGRGFQSSGSATVANNEYVPFAVQMFGAPIVVATQRTAMYGDPQVPYNVAVQSTNSTGFVVRVTWVNGTSISDDVIPIFYLANYAP